MSIIFQHGESVLFDPRVDRHPWTGNKPKPPGSRKETHIPLSVDPLEEPRDTAEKRMKAECEAWVEQFVRDSYGDRREL